MVRSKYAGSWLLRGGKRRSVKTCFTRFNMQKRKKSKNFARSSIFGYARVSMTRISGGDWAVAIAVFAVLAATLFFASAAQAVSVGEIVRAEASSDWSTASFELRGERTHGCQTPPSGPPSGPGGAPPPPTPESEPWQCGWILYATVGPGTQPSDCSSSGRRRSAIGPGVQLVWSGPELSASGSVSANLSSVALSYGSSAPLLCLSAVEAVAEPVVCPQGGGISCPDYGIVHRYVQLDAEVLTPQQATAPSSSSPAPAESTVAVQRGPGSKPCRKPARKSARFFRRGSGGAGVTSSVALTKHRKCFARSAARPRG